MLTMVVHFRRGRLCAALLPRHPQDETERDRRQHGPRYLCGPPAARKRDVSGRGEDGLEGRAKNDQLRHDDAGDADDE